MRLLHTPTIPTAARSSRLALLLGALACGPDEGSPKDSGAPEESAPPVDTTGDSGTPEDSGDSAPDSGDSGDSGEPADDCTPVSDAAVTLCADRFWAQELDATSQAELAAALAAMPAELQDEDLEDPALRARQLQWAIVAANALSAASVSVLVPEGTYDFSELHEAHPDVPEGDFYQEPLRPKLFVRRDDLTLRAAVDGAEVVLTASGPGADGEHHGRVFVLLDSSYTRLTVQGLSFRGDAESERFADPATVLHENAASLYYAYQWGYLMVGLNGGGNEMTVEDCRFEAVNGNAISAVGALTVRRSVFEGAVPDPEEADPDVVVEELLAAIIADLGVSPGMDMHSGIRRAYAYGPTVIEDSAFSGFVQGVLLAADGYPLEISGNGFTAIYDHALYIFGEVDGGVVEGNLFERTGNGAVKFAANTTESDPERSLAGLHDGEIRDNRFVLARNSSIFFSGVRNEISGNEVAAYDPSSDPTGWYDPDYRPGHRYPDAFLITESGQAGWSNHIANNTFEANTRDDEDFTIFLQQRPAIADRSISGNTVTGAGQTVYFHHLVPCDTNPAPCSDYTPEIAVEDGATLVVGAPEDCADCYPEASYYLSELP